MTFHNLLYILPAPPSFPSLLHPTSAQKFHGELGDFIESLQATKQKVQRGHSLKLEAEELKAGRKNLQVRLAI